ncbi:heparan sulfate glucosamine 3-O-sulfotransferase 3A1-like [Ptychodera flava]|uniref:heparan sulfate glucosamine 3-O-sulfotransferase 3A1-like n=1 Tax=Ptychodera flava TaxID=63121 RepID=UPI00396A7DEA
MVCDPVRRLISDYLEFVNKTDRDYTQKKNMADTVEETVFESNVTKNVRIYNEMVDVGVYVKHLFHWLEYFPRKQMHFMDGDNFRNDPADELRKLETFLGVEHHFRKEHFYFDSSKQNHCVAFPKNFCMPSAKGRHHPVVADWALQKLCEFYKPYDNALTNLLRQRFTWVGKNC